MPRLLALLLLAATPALHATSLDVVRANFTGYYTAAGAARTAPRMQEALNGLESQARAYAAPGYLRADGSWSDIDYSETPSGSWSPWDHTRRLVVMAKAYRTPGQALYGDPQLRTAIESALAYIPTYYAMTTIPNGNWWFWTIGVPLDLGPTLVLMRGDVRQSVIDDCTRSIAIKIGSSPTSKGLIGPTPTGENLVWSCFTHLALALLRDDAIMLAGVRDAMASACATTSGDGIQIDRSFHQHGAQIYNGGYGAAFANDVATYALIARGTEFELPTAALSTFADYLVDGIAWSLYANYFDVSVVGREVARSSTSGYNGLAALVQGAQFDSPRRAEIAAAAARMLQTWGGGLGVELAGAATLVEQSAMLPAAPSGYQHYFTSDYSVHRRAGWFASIKMFSSRTKSGERTNGENLLGSRQSDGRFYLVKDGSEYFAGDIWPAYDWSRLPGTTVERKADAANDTYGLGTRDFVGGTGDGRRGVSAMDYAPLNSTLTARKSWFFFDDAIVFLTSGIASVNPAETIVAQQPGGAFAHEADWYLVGGVGYWFPSGGSIHAQPVTRSGTWAALGASTDATPHTSTFFTLWLDHAADNSASYVVLPEASAGTMRNWSATRPLQIIANDAGAAAVRDTRDGALGIVFWRAGISVEGITSTLPCVVWLTRDGLLSAADPTNGSGTFTLTVNGTKITVPRDNGRTFRMRLQTRQRAVRH